jgi:microbial collagenase
MVMSANRIGATRELAGEDRALRLSIERLLGFDAAREIAAGAGMRLGEGVTIAQFDSGWDLDHPFVASYLESAPLIERIDPEPDAAGSSGHGNAVLGLLIGGFNGAPDLEPLLPGASIVLASAVDTEEQSSNVTLASTIELLAEKRAGVLLIARDWSSRAPHLPYELRSGVAELLLDAHRRGIVVVQSAGNGGLCLDDVIQRSGPFVRRQVTMRSDAWLDPNDLVEPAFIIDSGALVVGATTATPPYRRWITGLPRNPQPKSNFGGRVDCGAPGERLFTVDANGPGAEPRYTSTFGGTSGSAALVSAAVAALQSLVLNASGTALTPAGVRDLFTDPRLGTPVSRDGGSIGPIPDIRRILQRVNCSSDER